MVLARADDFQDIFFPFFLRLFLEDWVQQLSAISKKLLKKLFVNSRFQPLQIADSRFQNLQNPGIPTCPVYFL